MYIWNTASLAIDIKNNSITQRSWKKYYLAMSIFMTLAMYISGLTPRENMLATLVEAIISIGILIFGISITYQSNKGDNGVDYISRMTALSFPISIKILLISFLYGALIGALNETVLFTEIIMEWIMVGFVTIIQIAFFWRLNVYLKYINAKE